MKILITISQKHQAPFTSHSEMVSEKYRVKHYSENENGSSGNEVIGVKDNQSALSRLHSYFNEICFEKKRDAVLETIKQLRYKQTCKFDIVNAKTGKKTFYEVTKLTW